MTRTAFLSFLCLGAAGQQIPPRPPKGNISCYYPVGSKYGDPMRCIDSDGNIVPDPGRQLKFSEPTNRVFPPKPPNGECPVCGTQAPPWKPKEMEAYFALYGQRVIMCAHCRVVFGQDAEGEK